MNGYAGWSRLTGAIPCALASAQLMRPFPLSSHAAISSGTWTEEAVATGGGTSPRANTIKSVEVHPANTSSRASASRWSIVSPYRCRTAITRGANQQRFCSGSHSAVSRARFSVAIQVRTRQGEVQQVGREATSGRRVRGAQTAVVRLGPSHHVLDVRVELAREPASRVRTVDPAQLGDDPIFDRLRVRVIVGLVG